MLAKDPSGTGKMSKEHFMEHLQKLRFQPSVMSQKDMHLIADQF